MAGDKRNEPARWEDLVLPSRERRSLAAIADRAGRRKSGRRSVAALFAGPAGTGKTLAAEMLAKELGRGLQRVDLGATVSKYIGETEKALDRVFWAAEAAGAVLMLDEADALFGKRTGVADSHDRFANLETGYLLERIEAFSGLAILATNLKQSLDDPFLRRFHFVVNFPRPSGQPPRS